MMRHFCKTLCLAGIVLLYCATITQAQPKEETPPQPTTKPVQDDGYYKMICRGEPGAFYVKPVGGEIKLPMIGGNRNLNRLKVEMFWRRSKTAPRGDYSKIEPGTCSWDDRIFSEEEQNQQNFFYASYGELQLIRNVLNTRDALYEFYIRLIPIKIVGGGFAEPDDWYFWTRNHKMLPPLSKGK